MLAPAPRTAIAESAEEPVRSYFVVLNRGSGRKKDEEAREAIERVFSEAGREVHFVCIDPGEVAAECQKAARLASEAGGALVAVGGDGTQNAAAQAALAHACPLGVIATGTFNLFARDNGLPLEPAEAAKALLRAEVEPVQVGLLNERVFLVNGSIGLYPQLLQDREVMKERLGRRRWVAVLSGLKTLLGWRRHLDIELELDGRLTSLHTPTLFVGNNRLQLEQAGVSPELASHVGEGRLVAMVARPAGRWAKLRWIARAVFGQLADSPEVDVHALRSLTVAAPRHGTLHAATDGETVQMVPPLRFSVSPRPLLLLKPVE
ncbi:diacylglycerol/lipid kinase family protein [Ramlibacter albus]|uniref:Diacylglycerol kinase n=1 Tax=Ramlibacter albus TaxID=2079448 RepID=A0A923M5H9_9BURK|nr:diacylglycerol kinase family protein [Ramlibacter albus]MBC5764206.1 diacylglycerol kinase [Ramlibacter albus]